MSDTGLGTCPFQQSEKNSPSIVVHFDLRKLFAAVTSSAVAIALLMYVTANYRAQQSTRSQLEAIGAYSVRFGEHNSIVACFHSPVASSSIAKFDTIECLDLKGVHVTMESLDHIASLRNVQTIFSI